MKKAFIFLSFVTAIAAVQSCKKSFLYRPPLDQLTNGVFYKTTEEVMAATAPLYNIVWFDYNDKASFAFGDARAGNMATNSWDAFYKFAVPATDQSTLLPAYKSFYKIVGQANLTIENIHTYATAVPQNIQNMAISEAKCMRALAYAFLVRNWGALPIIYNNVAQLGDTSIRRNTVESIWQFIIKDLRYAVDNLPATAYQPGRLTKWSAEGLLAKMYLTRAGLGKTEGNRSQSDLDSAKYLAGDIIKNSGLTLYPNYYDMFRGKNNNSSNPNPEGLFALQWMPIRDPWGINNSFQAYMAFDPKVTGTGDGWGAAHGASADLIKYYMNNPADSIRRKASFMFNGDDFPELDAKDGGIHYTSTGVQNVKKYIIGTPDDNGGKGAQMAAFTNTFMLRLAEVYLIYAEAIMGNAQTTTDADALKYFNMVRTRAGMPTLATLKWDDIFQEKRIETAMEGVYWYELVRLYYYNPAKAKNMINAQDKGGYTVSYIAGTSNPRQYNVTYNPVSYPVTDQTFYLPIPETEMVKAPYLSKDPVPFDFSKYPQ